MTLVKLRQQRWQNIESGSGASHDCFDVPMYLFSYAIWKEAIIPNNLINVHYKINISSFINTVLILIE